MIDTDQLKLMKAHAILLNVARAKIVNGATLKSALEKGQLAKAVFDGHYQEPVPTKERYY